MPAKRKVVGLWPRFYATIWLFAIAHESMFMSYRKKQRHQHFLLSHRADASYYIASRAMTHDDLIFMLYHDEQTTMIHFSSYCMREQASEQWPRGIEKSKPVHVISQWANDFYCYSREKRWQEAYFTRRIARNDGDERIFTSCPKWQWGNCMWEHVPHREDATTWHFFDVAKSSCTDGGQWFDHRETRGTQQSNFSCCPSKDDSNKRCWSWDNGNERTLVRCITRSDDDEGWLQRGMRDRATQQPTTKKHRIASTRATSRHPIMRRTMMSIFYCRIAMSKQQRIQFFRLIARERAK